MTVQLPVSYARPRTKFELRCRPASLRTPDAPPRAAPETAGPGRKAFRRTLARLENAVPVVKRWEKRRSAVWPKQWTDVRASILSFDPRVLYATRSTDVEAAVRKTAHALGGMRSEEANSPQNKDIQGLSAPYPVMLVIHECMEALGRVPEWDEFRSYMETHRTRLLDFYLGVAGVAWNGNERLDWSAGRMPVVQFRLGNAYYAFLREIHVLLSLRERGLDIHYSVLFDVEFKADAFLDGLFVEIYIASPFKTGEGDGGRKLTARQVSPGQKHVRLVLFPNKAWGRCWLASKESIDEAYRNIMLLLQDS